MGKFSLAFLVTMGFAFSTPLSAEVTYPDKMCTNGFGKPAYLLSVDDGWELHVGKKVERIEYQQGIGQGFLGQVVLSKGKSDTEIMYHTELTTYDGGGGEGDLSNDVVPLIIFRDRTFWTCVGKSG